MKIRNYSMPDGCNLITGIETELGNKAVITGPDLSSRISGPNFAANWANMENGSLFFRNFETDSNGPYFDGYVGFIITEGLINGTAPSWIPFYAHSNNHVRGIGPIQQSDLFEYPERGLCACAIKISSDFRFSVGVDMNNETVYRATVAYIEDLGSYVHVAIKLGDGNNPQIWINLSNTPNYGNGATTRPYPVLLILDNNGVSDVQTIANEAYDRSNAAIDNSMQAINAIKSTDVTNLISI